MDIQLLVVLLVFALALFFVGRKLLFKTSHKAKGDCAGCGDSKADNSVNLKK